MAVRSGFSRAYKHYSGLQHEPTADLLSAYCFMFGSGPVSVLAVYHWGNWFCESMSRALRSPSFVDGMAVRPWPSASGHVTHKNAGPIAARRLSIFARPFHRLALSRPCFRIGSIACCFCWLGTAIRRDFTGAPLVGSAQPKTPSVRSKLRQALAQRRLGPVAAIQESRPGGCKASIWCACPC